jgi:hypothetical protein
MVKLQRRMARKQYLNSKRVYEYERISLGIPKIHHKILGSLLDRDFDFSIRVENEVITITLLPKKAQAQA